VSAEESPGSVTEADDVSFERLVDGRLAPAPATRQISDAEGEVSATRH